MLYSDRLFLCAYTMETFCIYITDYPDLKALRLIMILGALLPHCQIHALYSIKDGFSLTCSILVSLLKLDNSNEMGITGGKLMNTEFVVVCCFILFFNERTI